MAIKIEISELQKFIMENNKNKRITIYEELMKNEELLIKKRNDESVSHLIELLDKFLDHENLKK